MFGWLAPHLRAHALFFDPKPAVAYDASAGVRLLVLVALIEGVLGPRLSLLTFLGAPLPPMWVRVPVLLAAVLLLVRFVVRIPLSKIGFYGWSRWSQSEKSYLVQVGALALVIFTLISARRLRALAADPAIWNDAALTFAEYFVWGVYQEVIYRGLLQTELVRRWGAAAGILVSNALYTFGPLHMYYLREFAPAEAAGLYAAVFAIGLFFAALFHRSGNLWLPAILHGVGDVFLTGLRRLVR